MPSETRTGGGDGGRRLRPWRDGAPYIRMSTCCSFTPWKITPHIESVIESALYMLWDLHMKVGHASRTVKE